MKKRKEKESSDYEQRRYEEWLKDCFAYTGPSPYIGVIEEDGVHWYKWNKRKKRYEEKRGGEKNAGKSFCKSD